MAKDYNWYVSAGKGLVAELKELNKKVEAYQAKIAQYAVEVCTIRHGGRSKGIYTVKQYANDIGLPTKTVSNWTNTYRAVVMKVKDDVSSITTKEWAAAQKTHDLLKQERVHQNRAAGKTGSRFAYKQTLPDEKVKSIYNSTINNEKPFEHEFLMLESTVQNIFHLIKTRDLGIISDARLLHVMTVLDKSSDIINDHLGKKKKKTA